MAANSFQKLHPIYFLFLKDPHEVGKRIGQGLLTSYQYHPARIGELR